jgi:hypothetical protein
MRQDACIAVGRRLTPSPPFERRQAEDLASTIVLREPLTTEIGTSLSPLLTIAPPKSKEPPWSQAPAALRGRGGSGSGAGRRHGRPPQARGAGGEEGEFTVQSKVNPRALACLVSRDSELAYLLRSLIKLSPPPPPPQPVEESYLRPRM